MEREQDGMEDDERGMNGEERFKRRGSGMGGGERTRWEGRGEDEKGMRVEKGARWVRI